MMMFSPQLQRQYEALISECGLAVLPRSQLAIVGGDRATLLHKFCTQDVLSQAPGEGGEAFILNVQGKTLGHVYFFVQQEQIVLDTASGQAEGLIQHLDRYVIREDVRFEDLSAAHSDLLVAGPKSKDVLLAAFVEVPPANLYAHVAAKTGDIRASVRRVPYLSGEAYFVSVPRQSVDAACQALVGEGATVCDQAVVDCRRIESATPLYGTDVTSDNLPQEVNRDVQAIHFKKGCYLGQETVARIDALGHVNKLLVRVKFSGQVEILPGMELRANEKVVGKVTSACWSPKYDGWLALAYVRREYASSGKSLESPVGSAEVMGI